jgi:epoxyqueuosine reductase QueG
MTEHAPYEEMVRSGIERFVGENAANRQPESALPYFDAPLVGFASIDDPLFSRYKEVIGEYHLTPGEFMESAFGPGSTGKGTVICWILPISPATRESNRRERLWPSREWACTRTHGETFNNLLRRHLADLLNAAGQRALAPLLSEGFRTVETRSGPSSTWSERHAAHAAGLGTFSLNDGLITGRGIAHRCGSVITDLVIPPTPRRYGHWAEYCLFYRDGSCGACIGRCPAGAITRYGHDKTKCYRYCYEEVIGQVGERFGVAAPGCGLCQTGVPCEAGIP